MSESLSNTGLIGAATPITPSRQYAVARIVSKVKQAGDLSHWSTADVFRYIALGKVVPGDCKGVSPPPVEYPFNSYSDKQDYLSVLMR